MKGKLDIETQRMGRGILSNQGTGGASSLPYRYRSCTARDLGICRGLALPAPKKTLHLQKKQEVSRNFMTLTLN